MTPSNPKPRILEKMETVFDACKNDYFIDGEIKKKKK